jgi:hypothetical protein
MEKKLVRTLSSCIGFPLAMLVLLGTADKNNLRGIENELHY